jgi:hypothetical protein
MKIGLLGLKVIGVLGLKAIGVLGQKVTCCPGNLDMTGN